MVEPNEAEGGAIRHRYEAEGVEGFYAKQGAAYRNPHEPVIHKLIGEVVRHWQLDLDSVLDLACGSGEVTLALRELGAGRIDGIDPYTGAAYLERTGREAERYRFEDIAAGILEGRHYRLVVCSFALHLLDESWLPALLFHLARLTDRLLILTPHKRPELNPAWGWDRDKEILIERVRARLYTSNRPNVTDCEDR